MFEREYTPEAFYSQLSETAPAVGQLLKTHTSRVVASISSHDAVNGYGTGTSFFLSVEVFSKRCQNCFEDGFSAPRFDCRWHKFEPTWIHVADAQAKTMHEAAKQLNGRVANWLAKAERRAA